MNQCHPYTALLETCPSTLKTTIKDKLSLINTASAAGISSTHSNTNATWWDIWHDFCTHLCCDPYLKSINNPIPLPQRLAHYYCIGALAPSGTPVCPWMVDGALHAIWQALAILGSPDPWLQPSGKLDLRLSQQLSEYSKQDPPPSQVKPIPFPIIMQMAEFCQLSHTTQADAIADVILLGFFFLLCLGEYDHTSNPDAAPFWLCNVHIFIQNSHLNHYTCSEAELQAVSYIAL
jgi:hypothetical protein